MFEKKRAIKKLAEKMPELRELRAALQLVRQRVDPLIAIIPFFNIISEWQDNGGVKDLIVMFEKVRQGEHNEVLKKLKTLQEHFVNAGRDRYGMNRTKSGQTVTEYNVFLGDIYGLFTHPVSFWKQRKDERKGGWGFSNMENFNAYDVVSGQARGFMGSHIESMINCLQIVAETT